MDIRVIEREKINIVGIPWNGTYKQLDQIPALFALLNERLDEVKYQKNQDIFITPFHERETELTYYVTVPVEELNSIPEGMVGLTIPGKSYVFTIHKGMAAEIKNTYKQIHRWMVEYGYEQDHHALCLEIHKSNIDKTHFFSKEIQIEIYIPVKKYTQNSLIG